MNPTKQENKNKVITFVDQYKREYIVNDALHERYTYEDPLYPPFVGEDFLAYLHRTHVRSLIPESLASNLVTGAVATATSATFAILSYTKFARVKTHSTIKHIALTLLEALASTSHAILVFISNVYQLALLMKVASYMKSRYYPTSYTDGHYNLKILLSNAGKYEIVLNKSNFSFAAFITKFLDSYFNNLTIKSVVIPFSLILIEKFIGYVVMYARISKATYTGEYITSLPPLVPLNQVEHKARSVLPGFTGEAVVSSYDLEIEGKDLNKRVVRISGYNGAAWFAIGCAFAVELEVEGSLKKYFLTAGHVITTAKQALANNQYKKLAMYSFCTQKYQEFNCDDWLVSDIPGTIDFAIMDCTVIAQATLAVKPFKVRQIKKNEIVSAYLVGDTGVVNVSSLSTAEVAFGSLAYHMINTTPGHSGCPITDTQGYVVGVHIGTDNDVSKNMYQMLDFLIPERYLKSVLEIQGELVNPVTESGHTDLNQWYGINDFAVVDIRMNRELEELKNQAEKERVSLSDPKYKTAKQAIIEKYRLADAVASNQRLSSSSKSKKSTKFSTSNVISVGKGKGGVQQYVVNDEPVVNALALGRNRYEPGEKWADFEMESIQPGLINRGKEEIKFPRNITTHSNSNGQSLIAYRSTIQYTLTFGKEQQDSTFYEVGECPPRAFNAPNQPEMVDHPELNNYRWSTTQRLSYTRQNISFNIEKPTIKDVLRYYINRAPGTSVLEENFMKLRHTEDGSQPEGMASMHFVNYMEANVPQLDYKSCCNLVGNIFVSNDVLEPYGINYDRLTKIHQTIDGTSSPGAPWVYKYANNSAVPPLELFAAVRTRINAWITIGEKVMNGDYEPSNQYDLALAAVASNGADPFLVTGKPEPRKVGKPIRPINSVSITTNLAIKYLLYEYLEFEKTFTNTPTMQKLDLQSKQSRQKYYDMFANACQRFPQRSVISSDIQGWDYSYGLAQQSQNCFRILYGTHQICFDDSDDAMLFTAFDVPGQNIKYPDTGPSLLSYAIIGYYFCNTFRVLQTPEGELIIPRRFGMQSSGTLTTYSDNSFARGYLAFRVRTMMKRGTSYTEFIRVSGDDCIEPCFNKWDDTMKASYIAHYMMFGFVVTEIVIQNTQTGFSFCSTEFKSRDKIYQENIWKSVYAFIYKKLSYLDVYNFASSYSSHPQYREALQLIVADLLTRVDFYLSDSNRLHLIASLENVGASGGLAPNNN